MQYRSADHAVAEWWRLVTTTRAPRAIDQVERRGWLYAEKCEACGRGEPVLVVNRSGARVERCSRCSAVWPRLEVEVAKAPPRPGARIAPRPPAQLDALATLDVVLEALPERESRVYGLHLITGRRRDETARLANRQGWRDLDGALWTEKRVRRAIRRCRKLLELELGRRGLLAA